MRVVLGEMIGDAGDAPVHVGAAEFLGGDDLAGRGLHQRRAAEEDRALLAHDDRSRRTSPAHRRRPPCSEPMTTAICGMPGADMLRLIVEDAAEMIAVGKDLVLQRQEGAAGIDQIDAGQAVLARDLLRAQMLLHRHRIVGAALDGRVVGDDHALAAGDAADAGDRCRAAGTSPSYMSCAASGESSRNGAPGSSSR